MAENRRTKMTKKMMQDALLELLEQYPLDKINVTDICKKADLNRSTFYAYYEEVGQLLLEIENNVLNSLPVSPGTPVTSTDTKFWATLEEFFSFVLENERLFRVLIVQRDSNSFNQRLINSVMEKYKEVSGLKDSLPDRYAYIYCVNGVIGILKEWITAGFPISPKEFAKIVLEMSTRATVR